MRNTSHYILLLMIITGSCKNEEETKTRAQAENIKLEISVYNRNYSFDNISYHIQIDSTITIRESTRTQFFTTVNLARGKHFLFVRDLTYDISSLIKFTISDSATSAGIKIFNEYVPPYQEHLEYLADARIRHKQLDTINNRDARKDYIKSLWNTNDKKRHRQQERAIRLEYYENEDF